METKIQGKAGFTSRKSGPQHRYCCPNLFGKAPIIKRKKKPEKNNFKFLTGNIVFMLNNVIK